MLTVHQLDQLQEEIDRFQARIDAARGRVSRHGRIWPCRETAALKRSSLDLSYMLADYRQGRLPENSPNENE